MRQLLEAAILLAQVAALLGILELMVGGWRLRRLLDDVHERLAVGELGEEGCWWEEVGVGERSERQQRFE